MLAKSRNTTGLGFEASAPGLVGAGAVCLGVCWAVAMATLLGCLPASRRGLSAPYRSSWPCKPAHNKAAACHIRVIFRKCGFLAPAVGNGPNFCRSPQILEKKRLFSVPWRSEPPFCEILVKDKCKKRGHRTQGRITEMSKINFTPPSVIILSERLGGETSVPVPTRGQAFAGRATSRLGRPQLLHENFPGSGDDDPEMPCL